MRVLVTRPTEDAERLAAPLRDLGIGVVVAPLLTVVDCHPDPVPDFVTARGLIVTSANGVRALQRCLRKASVPDAVYALPVLAVGEHTAGLLREAGFTDVRSANGDSSALLDLACRTFTVGSGPLYHLAGVETAGNLSGELRAKGYDCTHVPLYETTPAPFLPSEVVRAFRSGELDGVVLCSARTAQVFASLVHQAGLDDRMASVTAWCLSQAVADSLGDLRFAAVHCAAEPGQDALLALFADKATSNASSAHAGEGQIRPESPPGTMSRARWRLPAVIVVFVLVLALAGWGTLPVWVQRVPAPFGSLLASWSGTPVESADLATLRGELDDVRLALGSMRQAVDQTRYRLALVEQQMQQEASDSVPDLEPGPGEDTSDDALLTRLEAMEASLQGLESRVPVPRDADIDRMARRLDELSRDHISAGTVLSLSDRVAVVEEQVRRSSGRQERVMALILAVGQLREAVDVGRPYALSLRSVRALLPEGGDSAALALSLQDYADSGVPTLVALDRQLEDLVPAIIRAGYGPDDRSAWWVQTLDSLVSVVSVRRVDGTDMPDSPAALTARAVEAAAGGDLASAVAELSRLSGQAAEVAQPWMQLAQARLSAEAALSVLMDEAVVRLGVADSSSRKQEG